MNRKRKTGDLDKMIEEKTSQSQRGIGKENWKQRMSIRHLLEENQVLLYRVR